MYHECVSCESKIYLVTCIVNKRFADWTSVFTTVLAQQLQPLKVKRSAEFSRGSFNF